MRLSSPGRRISASPTSSRFVAAAAALVLAVAPALALADGSHDAEIQAFASTMAIVRTARDECQGATLDEAYLESLRLRLHIVEEDHSAFAPQAHAAADLLLRGLAEAPSRQAWCDAVWRLYRPEGTPVRGILRR